MTKYVGEIYTRKEDYRLITGNAKFVADYSATNMIEINFVRSSYAHAEIENIDVKEAKDLDGVLDILTYEDIAYLGRLAPLQKSLLPESIVDKINHTIQDCHEDILAKNKVVYQGQPVAVILADSRYIAEDAAMLVKVDYKPLESVVDPLQSVEDNSPIIHPHMNSNVQATIELSTGDVNKAFKESDHILSCRIKTPRVAHNPMETRGIFTTYDTRLKELKMITSTQVPYEVRNTLSSVLKLPEENIRVIAPDVGGGFGLKGPVYTEEVLCGYLSMKYKRPIKWIEDRLENLSGSRHGRDQIHDVKVAFKKDGKITAIKDNYVLDCGAYNTPLLNIPYNGAIHLRGMYKIENYEAKGRCILTNKAPVVPYRGAGRPEVVFTMDRVIYKVAEYLNIDPTEIMYKNMIQPEEMPYDTGLIYRDGSKAIYDSGDYPAGLDKALEIIDYKKFRKRQKELKKKGNYVGIGISSFVEGTGVGPYEGARILLDSTGQIIVYVGSSPHGQGHETVFSQICADELGISPDQVTVKAGDTSLLQFGVGTFASRSAVVAGSAVRAGTEKFKNNILSFAASILETDKEKLSIKNGKISSNHSKDKCLTFEQLGKLSKPSLQKKGQIPELEVTYYFTPETVTYSSGFHIAQVEIDIKTGFIEILRYITVDDVGKVINPMIVEGQTQGGVAQGIGEAIYEEVIYNENGQLLTGSYMDYLIPTSMEVPNIQVSHYSSLSTRNSSGYKGAGEGGAISPLGAIANAISDALEPLKVKIDELPISPSFLYNLIQKSQKQFD